ncbi:beta-propeller domain-containing protein [Deltaproteobacteria bacterium TL4]
MRSQRLHLILKIIFIGILLSFVNACNELKQTEQASPVEDSPTTTLQSNQNQEALDASADASVIGVSAETVSNSGGGNESQNLNQDPNLYNPEENQPVPPKIKEETSPMPMQPTPAVGQFEFRSAENRNVSLEDTQNEALDLTGVPNGSGLVNAVSNDVKSNTVSEGGTLPAAGVAGNDAAGSAETKTDSVEEGDIYRVSPDGLIFNLNAYRGLQIIDFKNPTDPQIVGRLRITGSPVEMYQVGNTLLVLLNHWNQYQGIMEDGTNRLAALNYYGGGVILVVDVSKPSQPKLLQQETVAGIISSSRLTRSDNQSALFVVSNNAQETLVKSYAFSSSGQLKAASSLNLGGYVSVIQATPARLLIARNRWETNRYYSEVTVIDISDAGGSMKESGSAQVAGLVQNKHNLNIEGTVLRVVSSGWTGKGLENHLQTFDASHLESLKALDMASFAPEQSLFATLFMGEKAFFVTYLRKDPFHTFEVDAQGKITEHSEFIVSGWNDFFQPAFNQTRLLGIGKNDEKGVNLAVSLYDVTDLKNKTPLLARAEIGLQQSWSEANWDDRAFSVLENATQITTDQGVPETGLILLPFSGWSKETGYQYTSGVQIFTFSATTLTRRGVMLHDSAVRRTFLADSQASTTANLSESKLSFFNTSNPDDPSALGAVELAPDYSQFFVIGDYGIRRKRATYDYWLAYDSMMASSQDQLQVVSLTEDADLAIPQAVVSIPSLAQSYQVGNLLVTVQQQWKEETWQTAIDVWDFQRPTQPVKTGNVTTTELVPGGAYAYANKELFMNTPRVDTVGPTINTTGAEQKVRSLNTKRETKAELATDASGSAASDVAPGYYPGSVSQTLILNQAVVFVNSVNHSELQGKIRVRSIYPVPQKSPVINLEICNGQEPAVNGGMMDTSTGPVLLDGTIKNTASSATDATSGTPSGTTTPSTEIKPGTPNSSGTSSNQCSYTYYAGGVFCQQLIYLDGTVEPEQCTGAIQWCAYNSVLFTTQCQEVGLITVPTQEITYEREQYHTWTQHELLILDLSNPSQPQFVKKLSMDSQQEAVAVLSEGNVVYYNYKVPFQPENDRRGFVKYYVTQIDLTQPNQPQISKPINIPGQLIHAQGKQLITQDQLWGEQGLETSVNALRLEEDRAILTGVKRFNNQWVNKVLLDGTGHILVSHVDYLSGQSNLFSVLDSQSPELVTLGRLNLDSWADFKAAQNGQVFFSVYGGLLMINVTDPTNPRLESFFALNGWPDRLTFYQNQIYLAAGLYGIYQFDVLNQPE